MCLGSQKLPRQTGVDYAGGTCSLPAFGGELKRQSPSSGNDRYGGPHLVDVDGPLGGSHAACVTLRTAERAQGAGGTPMFNASTMMAPAIIGRSSVRGKVQALIAELVLARVPAAHTYPLSPRFPA